MRRRPRPPVSGVSLPSPATPGSRAISSRRNRNRTQHHAVNRDQNHTRARSRISRLLTAQQRPPVPSSDRFYSALSSLIESAAKESRDNVIMASQSFAVPWHRIKLWIEAQEKAEQQGHNPNPMTKTQLLALSHIVSFMEGAEPDVGGMDYVSFLMQFLQHSKTHKGPPAYQDVGLDIPINGAFHTRWRTTCSLPSVSHMVFPCEGHGFSQGEQPPLFATKKGSKQYAAKHALAYLQDTATSPPANTPVPAPAPAPAPTFNSVSGGVSIKPAVPPLKSPKPSDSSADANSSSLAMPPGDTGGAPLVPPPPSTEMTAKDKPMAETKSGSIIAGSEFYNGDVPSLVKQAVDEAIRLNFGSFKYDIEFDLEKPGFFVGKPTFQNGGRMPADVGHVTGAMSKNAAKEAIAEKLLAYFKTESEKRDNLFRSFTSTPPPKKLT